MTDLTTRPGYDGVGYPIPTPTGPYCGNCKSRIRHIDVEAIKLCYWIEQDQQQQVENELAAERALEDRGYWDARAQEDWEAANGVIPFDVAWHNESPETCPCGNHDPKPVRGWWDLPIAASMWAADGRDLGA